MQNTFNVRKKKQQQKTTAFEIIPGLLIATNN